MRQIFAAHAPHEASSGPPVAQMVCAHAGPPQRPFSHATPQQGGPPPQSAPSGTQPPQVPPPQLPPQQSLSPAQVKPSGTQSLAH